MNNPYKHNKECWDEMMHDASHEHMCHWIEQQKKLLEKWRCIVKERSKEQDDLFQRWSKLWMCTGFDMLEMQKESMKMGRKARLDHIDSYLKYLDCVWDADCPPRDHDRDHGPEPKDTPKPTSESSDG